MEKQKEKKIEVEKRKTRVTKRRKRELVVVGANEGVVEPFAGPKTDLFEGYSFCRNSHDCDLRDANAPSSDCVRCGQAREKV